MSWRTNITTSNQFMPFPIIIDVFISKGTHRITTNLTNNFSFYETCHKSKTAIKQHKEEPIPKRRERINIQPLEEVV